MRGKTLVACLLALPLAACLGRVQHNDVLIFGTDTKLAVDVSADATSAGTPEVTIGYKRKEAVWMPLVVNGTGVADKIVNQACVGAAGEKQPCATGLDGLKYKGEAETPKSGKSGTDAYSVFASFGANIKGSTRGGSEAGVGLAQFFATGIAAQRLAQNSQVVSALSLHGDESGEVAAAAAEAAVGLSDTEILGRAEAIKARNDDTNVAELFAACSKIKSAASVAALVAPADVSPEAVRMRSQLSAVASAADARRVIDKWGYRKDIEAAARTACPGGA